MGKYVLFALSLTLSGCGNSADQSTQENPSHMTDAGDATRSTQEDAPQTAGMIESGDGDAPAFARSEVNQREPAAGRPFVKSIQGTISEGQSVRITGSRFGSKPFAQPLYWFEFEKDDMPSGLGRNKKWVNPFNRNPMRGERTDAKSYTGNYGWRYDCDDHGGIGVNFSSDQLYVNIKRFYDFDMMAPEEQGPRGFNLKTHRIWSMPWGNKNNVLLGYQSSDGVPGGNPRVTAENTQIQGSHGPGFSQTNGKWMNEEIIFQMGDLNVQNGVFDYVREGKNQWTRRFVMRNTAHPKKYGFIAFDQVSNGTGPGRQWVYYDNIYIDETYSRVVLGDARQYDKCTNFEPQIPSQWSDISIEITINQGRFQPGETCYLFVVDSSNTSSLTGQSVTVGR